MTGLVRKATLTACGMLVAASAFAGVPSPGNSTLPAPAFLTVVGSSLGTADPLGTFSITVRDLANNPINGSSVVLDFSAGSDLQLCSDQLDAGATVNCAAKSVRKFTDASGVVSFTVVGGGTNAGATAGAGLGSVKVYADGVLLGSMTSAILNQDGGLSGVGANDISVWIADFGSGNYYGRSDYDYSTAIGANDLSLLIGAFGALGSTEGCSTYCP
ncbi:MAG: hypothetical protein U0704_17155 [Candidatus Eisenbacteria bacterium]